MESYHTSAEFNRTSVTIGDSFEFRNMKPHEREETEQDQEHEPEPRWIQRKVSALISLFRRVE